MGPLVTVYITTHNRGDKLTRAVKSVVSQTYPNIEIVISDDGSSDDTQERCLQLASQYPCIKYVRSDVPRGANHARNRALELAEGAFITGLDDDDEFLENRVELFVDSWREDAAFICDNFISVYPSQSVAHYKDSQKPFVRISTRDLLFGNYASNQIFTKVEYLRKISGFNEDLKRLQDWDCWLRLSHRQGDGFRLNGKTYLMHHDVDERVSKNQGYDQAFRTLVKVNIDLYEEYFSKGFISRNLLCDTHARIMDLFSCRSMMEVKYVLKRYRIYSFLKKVLKKPAQIG